MNHSWKPDITRAAQGVEVCRRPGCTAERRPTHEEKRGGHAFVHRPNSRAVWDNIMLPRCTGGSMKKARKVIDRGDEF